MNSNEQRVWMRGSQFKQKRDEKKKDNNIFNFYGGFYRVENIVKIDFILSVQEVVWGGGVGIRCIK